MATVLPETRATDKRPPGQAAPRQRRAPGLAVAVTPLVAMGFLLGIGYGVYHLPSTVLLILAAFVTGSLGLVLGFGWREMERGIVEAITKAMPAILVVLAIGMLIGSWLACGTIPMVIYYGLEVISPRFFLVTACLACSIVSMATGTSYGTVGTIGVAFIGIATGLGIPLGAAGGAIIAGAYFGDKMSPLSATTNLAPVAAGANLFDNIRHMMWSGGLAWLLGLLSYLVVGFGYGGNATETEAMRLVTDTLAHSFRFHWLLLLPIAIVFYFAVTKRPIVPSMIVSSLVAGVLAVVFQASSIAEVVSAMNTGYRAQTGVPQVDQLLSRGGIMSMMETQTVAFAAFSFGGIMQSTGLLAVLLARVQRFANRVWSLVSATIGAALLTAIVTGSSFLSIIIPAELFAPLYIKQGLAAKNLARIVEEAGAIMVPLIPWSIAGVYMATTMGVPTFTYLPWAIMNYASVLLLALYGVTGFTMARRIREDETEIGS
jgi:NhaC family Na+:H+ antiporter